MSCICLLYIELLNLIHYCYPPALKKQRIYCPEQIYMMVTKQHSPPLHHTFMMFSGDSFKQGCVGDMNKLEKNFLGFTDSMHKIGNNTTKLTNQQIAFSYINVNNEAFRLGDFMVTRIYWLVTYAICFIVFIIYVGTTSYTAINDEILRQSRSLCNSLEHVIYAPLTHDDTRSINEDNINDTESL